MSYTKVKSYTDKEILDRVKNLSNFKNIPSDYWIVGIRSEEDTPNVFDDKFYLFKGEKFILVTTGTTNPGTPSLLGGYKKNKLSGSFILKSDYWHYDFWSYGLHNGKMPALRQATDAIGYRDNNNNDKAEEIGDIKKATGINFHFNSYDLKTKIVKWIIGGWSEGCQVANKAEDYNKIIELTKPQKRTTYCLLKEF